MFFSFEVLLEFLSYMILGVGYISHSNLFPEPLDIEEEKIYLEKMKNGDTNVKKILIERNLRLVAHVAKKYQTTNVEQDDLISIGTIGLIKGINSFNMDKNYKLATYVARCIENEILMHLRANKKYALDMYLNEPIGKDKDDNIVTLQEVIEIDEKNIEEEIDLKFKIKEMKIYIDEILTQREKLIINLRYGLNNEEVKTQNEIAKILGISRSYVSRIENAAIQKLSRYIKND